MIPYNLSWSLMILYDPLQYSMTIQPLHDPYVIHMLSVCYVSHTHIISSHHQGNDPYYIVLYSNYGPLWATIGLYSTI